MKKLIILLLFLQNISFAQTSLDYKLYSKVIDDCIDQWDEDRDTISNVVVIKKFKPPENYVQSYSDEIYDEKEEIAYMMLHYNSSLISLAKTDNVKDAIMRLGEEFYATPKLTENNLQLKTKVRAISNSRFKRFFRPFIRFNIGKGWKRFYQKFPNTIGVYEFSKIVYSGDYACMYIGHHGGGLFGSGDIIILKKNEETWKIIAYLNLWMS